jgi:hypothetical protein
MTEIPGIVVPAEHELEDLLDEVSTHEPLMTLPQPDEDEGWVGTLDAMIASGLFGV